MHELIKSIFMQAYSTCASDEQTHCVCVYLSERVLFAGTECNNHWTMLVANPLRIYMYLCVCVCVCVMLMCVAATVYDFVFVYIFVYMYIHV